MTDEDKRLLKCLEAKTNELQSGIKRGRPYVWELRLKLADFTELEQAIKASIDSHGGDHRHLISTEEMALKVVIYLAEWYKRRYNGKDNEQKAISLNTDELKQIFELSGIDKQTFVYNTEKQHRWIDSLYVLGGLAVKKELTSEGLTTQLCRIYHGENIELEDLGNDEAVALKESIKRRHSLYEYLKCILDRGKTPPFAPEDMTDAKTMIPQLIERIENADREAKRNKFDFEWIVTYNNRGGEATGTMVRQLKVRMKPEAIGNDEEESRRLYLGYDRLRQWGMENPEEEGRIEFYLRFKNGSTEVKSKRREGRSTPIFEYHNTGSEKTGFHSVNMADWNTCADVPVEPFDRVELVMKYGDHARIVQKPLEVKGYMQVYAVPKSGNKFSSQRKSQSMTAVIFSTGYHLAEGYKEIPVVSARFRNGEQVSDENYYWCAINDKVIIADNNGNNVMPPFFNRSGLYQVVIKKYLKTIKYRDNVFVIYKYADIEDDGDEETEEIPVLFGRSGLSVVHYDNADDTEGNEAEDYELEWKPASASRYTSWKNSSPSQGEIKIRVRVNGIEFKRSVYYVPFTPTTKAGQPIWRDFENCKICTALKGVDDIEDAFDMKEGKPESDTIPLEIGNAQGRILMDIYRPVKLRELSQKCPSETKVWRTEDGTFDIPLINCDQFSIRDFSEDGVREYQIGRPQEYYDKFPRIDNPNINLGTALSQSMPISEIDGRIALDYVNIYIARLQDEAHDLYAWNYTDEPRPVGSESEMEESGIVFQSMKDDNSPRHYRCPEVKTDDGFWGADEDVATDKLKCFETIAEHNVYFFMFKPMLEVIRDGKQTEEILKPLLEKRNNELTGKDLHDLQRFAMEFHFDWNELPEAKEIIETQTLKHINNDHGTEI